MTRETDRTAEHRVQEYEVRMRRVDELLEQARREADRDPAGGARRQRLEEITRERERLTLELDALRLASPERPGSEEIRAAGPTGAWDALAQQIERLVEKLQR